MTKLTTLSVQHIIAAPSGEPGAFMRNAKLMHRVFAASVSSAGLTEYTVLTTDLPPRMCLELFHGGDEL